jgi:hypothetical protein
LKTKATKLAQFSKEKPKPDTIHIDTVTHKTYGRRLALNIRFKLTPIAHALCSYLRIGLYFDTKLVKNFYTSIPQSPKKINKQLKVEAGLKFGKVTPGPHTIKVTMVGVSTSGEALGRIYSKEFPIDVPSLEEMKSKMRRQIIVEKIKGSGISVITSDIKQIYEQMAKRRKKELETWREGW